MTQTFRGCYTVCVTPFSVDGLGVDTEALRRFIGWQLEVGVPGLIVLGSTGEFLALSDEERTEVVETTVDAAAGRVPVLVGTMNAFTPRAVAYSRQAEELGADGLMILPPYYYTPTDDEIFGYYRAICEAVNVPIMLYNNPTSSNVDLSAALVARLTQAFEQIRYIKEGSRDVLRVRQVIEATDGMMSVFAGEHALDSYLLGAVGYVNPFGNYVPRASAWMWTLLEAGRIEDARRIQRLLDEMAHTIAEGHPTWGHRCYAKRLAAVAGYPVGDVRPPNTLFSSLGEEGERRVEILADLMRRLDVLVDELSTDVLVDELKTAERVPA